MIEKIKKVLLQLGLDKISRKIFKIFFWKRRLFMKFPPYGDSFQKYILSRLDPVRYESIALALNTIEKQKLDGAIAEVGVYRGETSKVINKFVSNKKIYLFDTFAGFPENDLEVDQDDRFRDTNIELVKKNIETEHLFFTTDLKKAVLSSNIIFICVGTPTNKKDNSANLKYVFQVAKEIRKYIKNRIYTDKLKKFVSFIVYLN